MGWALWHITFNPTAKNAETKKKKNAETVKASSVYIASSRLDAATQWHLVSKKTKNFFIIYFNIFRKFEFLTNSFLLNIINQNQRINSLQKVNLITL